MELIRHDDPKYRIIKNEYSKLILNITKEENYEKFIGGLPITLERKDCYKLFSKSKESEENYRYSITTKVDGIRVLLFSCKIDLNKYFYFVDRENNFYQLKNKKDDLLPIYNGSPFLIDGELIIFLNNEKTTTDLSTNFREINSYSFMAFDILYGPTRIEYSDESDSKTFLADTSAAMAGPIGSTMWPYFARYDFLYRLILFVSPLFKGISAFST